MGLKLLKNSPNSTVSVLFVDDFNTVINLFPATLCSCFYLKTLCTFKSLYIPKLCYTLICTTNHPNIVCCQSNRKPASQSSLNIPLPQQCFPVPPWGPQSVPRPNEIYNLSLIAWASDQMDRNSLKGDIQDAPRLDA